MSTERFQVQCVVAADPSTQPADGGALVTSYYDWSGIDTVWRERDIFPILSEGACGPPSASWIGRSGARPERADRSEIL